MERHPRKISYRQAIQFAGTVGISEARFRNLRLEGFLPTSIARPGKGRGMGRASLMFPNGIKARLRKISKTNLHSKDELRWELWKAGYLDQWPRVKEILLRNTLIEEDGHFGKVFREIVRYLTEVVLQQDRARKKWLTEPEDFKRAVDEETYYFQQELTSRVITGIGSLTSNLATANDSTLRRLGMIFRFFEARLTYRDMLESLSKMYAGGLPRGVRAKWIVRAYVACLLVLGLIDETGAPLLILELLWIVEADLRIRP